MNGCTMLFSCYMLLYEPTHYRLGIGLRSAKPLARNKLQLYSIIQLCTVILCHCNFKYECACIILL